MVYAVLGLVLLLIFLLVAIRIGINRGKSEAAVEPPIIHKSGIYSIVRRSPRESIGNHKPTEDDLRQYLEAKNEDMEGKKLSDADKQRLVEKWKEDLESSIAEVESGDREGVEFYLYEYSSKDPVCEAMLQDKCFVSREQIFKYPNIIPPFHLGCRCELKRCRGDENLRDTATYRMRRLFDESNLPRLPDWKQVLTVE